MSTGQAISIALKPGLLQLSLHSWPKRWIMGACKTVIAQEFQDTRLGIMIWNKAGLNVSGKLYIGLYRVGNTSSSKPWPVSVSSYLGEGYFLH